jgi:hypothetical protein
MFTKFLSNLHIITFPQIPLNEQELWWGINRQPSIDRNIPVLFCSIVLINSRQSFCVYEAFEVYNKSQV